MVSRIYVEKKPGFDVEAQQLTAELRTPLNLEALENVRFLNRYDVEGISDELFAETVPTVFSEPQSDTVYRTLPSSSGEVFAVEYLPGQFDQRAALRFRQGRPFLSALPDSIQKNGRSCHS